MASVEVTGLSVYPVKGMKGVSLHRAVLTAVGLEHDRRWMVVRENGRFVTQRELPDLALIKVRFEPEQAVLSLNGNAGVAVPFRQSGGRRIHTRVWRADCEAVDEGQQLSDWLTETLKSKDRLRLVRMAPGFTRPQSHPDKLGAKTTTLFADAAPFLVVNEASLAALNGELQSRGHGSVPMNRFRPNIVIRGLEPFAEHAGAEIQGADWRLRFCMPCERCLVTTIDQETARRDPGQQPFKTIRDMNPAPDNPRAPAFGEYATLISGEGRSISVGDTPEIVVQ